MEAPNRRDIACLSFKEPIRPECAASMSLPLFLRSGTALLSLTAPGYHAGVMTYRVLPESFYRRDTETVARELLGRYLVREVEGERRVLRIVETEAYLGGPDRASHAWNDRRTERVASLYLPGGHAYVYFIYGMHFCLNATTGGTDRGSAVLFRAGEPVEGAEAMRESRNWMEKKVRPGDLAGGPGKICQALRIDRDLDGHLLTGGPLYLTEGDPVPATEIAAGPRVGVAYAGEAATWPLRFAVRGHRHVSRPRLT
jgi:DNA-3-methyladenine glycosylase